jgi:cytochrome c-type biogenesis protein CcmH
VVAILALVVLPIGAGAFYLEVGSPELPAQPLSARASDPQNQSIEHLIAQVEAHLESNPEDPRGWEVIAPVYLRLGRFDDAVKARRNVLRLDGETAERQADLGEALVGAANGVVTAEAKAAFESERRARCRRCEGSFSGVRPSRMAAAPMPPRSGARC